MTRIDRRAFLQTVSIGGAAFAFTPIAGMCDTVPKPNIVYILADDMGYGDVKCLNPQSRIPTPNIDRLGKEGMIFTDAHSGSAVCTPTRYGILTGRYCWRTALKRGVLWGYSPHLIDPARMTVASMLREHGYNTGCIGKWHLGMDLPTTDGKPVDQRFGANVDWNGSIENGPTGCGFDYFYGISASLDMHPYIYIHDNRFDGECTTVKAFHRTGPAHEDFDAVDVLPQLTRKAVEYIEKQTAEKPFFLYVPMTAPHTPIIPKQKFWGRTRIGPYGDFCVQVDASVGEILDALDRSGLANDTLVIFTSDNGCAPYIGVEQFERLGHYPSYIYRGYKADIWEGGHRVPFIVRWPNEVAAGTRNSQTICLTDLMATCADILGYDLPDDAGEDSVSILPALTGGTGKEPLREATVHHSFNGAFSIRQGRWKLEFCPGSGGWTTPTDDQAAELALPSVQLYDMETDPGEKINVFAEHPEIVKRMTALMTKYVTDGRSTPGAKQKNDGPEYWPELSWMKKM